MLELTEDTFRNCFSFACPMCGTTDTTYDGMPVKCYVCRYVYIEDFEDFIFSLAKRKEYYRCRTVIGFTPNE